MTKKNPEFYGRISVFFCAFLWSTSGLFIKLVNAHPLVIAGGRSFLAAMLMLGIRFYFMRRTNMPLSKMIRVWAVWASGLSYAATMILFVIANKLTASANAILLQYSAPAWGALFALILIREKPRAENWISLGMVMGGLVLFFKGALAGGSLAGDIIALISGVCYGANSVFLRMQKEGNPADGMMMAHIITAVISIPFYILYPFNMHLGESAAIFFMGFFQIGLASVLYSYGLKRISALAALIIACIEPVLNPVWVLLVTGEKPSSHALIGGGIIVLAVIVSSLRTLRSH